MFLHIDTSDRWIMTKIDRDLVKMYNSLRENVHNFNLVLIFVDLKAQK